MSQLRMRRSSPAGNQQSMFPSLPASAQRRAGGLGRASRSGPGLDFEFGALPSGPGARGVVKVSSDPTPVPAAPKPQKGETRLGELEIEGVKEPIFKSFVPEGLWWFNGATPTLATLYRTTATLPFDSLGAGQFSVRITAGADKVAFDGGGATLQGKDLKSATLKTLAPSAKADDVHVDVEQGPAGAKKLAKVASVDLTVRAPHHLELLGTEDRAEGAQGYNSVTSLRVFDNLNEPMPYIDTNEDFTVGKLEPGVDKRWGDSLAARHKGSTLTHGNAVFKDNYSASVSGNAAGMVPPPSNPRSPLGKTLAITFEHDWFVGSATTGKGVHVSHHIGRFYSDHAEYTALVSPIPAAPAAPAAKGAAPPPGKQDQPAPKKP